MRMLYGTDPPHFAWVQALSNLPLFQGPMSIETECAQVVPEEN
jgi:hypothetical protein